MTAIMMANNRYHPRRSAAKKQAPVATKNVVEVPVAPEAEKKREAEANLFKGLESVTRPSWAKVNLREAYGRADEDQDEDRIRAEGAEQEQEGEHGECHWIESEPGGKSRAGRE